MSDTKANLHALTVQGINNYFECLAVSDIGKELLDITGDNNLDRETVDILHETKSKWVSGIRGGGLLRILRHVGAIEGERIDLKRLETALLTINFVLSCGFNLPGKFLYFDHGYTEIRLYNVRRVLFLVRKAGATK